MNILLKCMILLPFVTVSIETEASHEKDVLNAIRRSSNHRLGVEDDTSISLSLEDGESLLPERMPPDLGGGKESSKYYEAAALNQELSPKPKERDNVVIIVTKSSPENNNVVNAAPNTVTDWGNMEWQNNGAEIFDMGPDEDIFGRQGFRRQSSKKNNDTDSSSSSSSSSDTSDSKDYEKNPGNPFTLFKDKYRQNWPWNYEMTGDHVNINPNAPPFHSLGPTGPELMFARKWWYFNQDDYKPMRRRR